MPDTTNTSTPDGPVTVTEVNDAMRAQAGSSTPGAWADTIAGGARSRGSAVDSE